MTSSRTIPACEVFYAPEGSSAEHAFRAQFDFSNKLHEAASFTDRACMRVLMLNPLYPPFAAGGSEKATPLLAEASVRAGHSVAVVTLHRQQSESMREANGVRVHRVPFDTLHWPFPPGAHPIHAMAKVLWRVLDL